MLMGEAPGLSLRAFDDDEEALALLLADFGRVLARLHRVSPGKGFGLLNIQQMERGVLSGSQATWADYLCTKLDTHLDICTSIDAITISEAAQILRLFSRIDGLTSGFTPALLHGDPGSHNAFADQEKISALLDWEDALIGDPVYDIAFWGTFHPERRHQALLDGYREQGALPDDFEQRFWLYYLRIALAKTVLRHRLDIEDRPGREPASRRIQMALQRLR